MADRLRFGIMGTGNIAGQFCAGVRSAGRSEVIAVGSRSSGAADAFAHAHGIRRAFGSYESLLRDANVDAVYLSLPNSMHCEWTLKALAAGKHVLCEKPLATSHEQAARMFDAADSAGKLLVEAFMYRSHPLTLAVKNAIDSNAIGRLKMIRTSFCYRTTKIAGNVRFDPALAGGCLMDVGCYCVNFSRHFAGDEPTVVSGVGQKHQTGVDDLFAGTLKFDNGILAAFSCGMSAQADNTAQLLGTDGYIEIPIPWKPPTGQAVYVIARGTPPKMDGPAAASHKPREVVAVPVVGDLYGIEADAFAAAVLDAKPAWVTRADTLGNAQTLDRLKSAAGF